MEFCALASGSSGNCFYIQRGNKAVLVDCGISAKQVTERLNAIGKSPDIIEGIFVTHEHSDHIRGIDVFANKNNIPVFLTKGTARNSFISRDENRLNFIKDKQSVEIGGMSIDAFSKSHDGSEPVSYTIETKDKRLSVITDIGYACKNVIDNVGCSDAIILESNYDERMLKQGPYPAYLKQRIASANGHISNYEAALLILQHGSSRLKNVMLSHLSQNNNTPEVALRTFDFLKERKDLKTKVHLSVREKPSDYVTLK
jgi:phosphoribosyl 1,2-cyclic phosphodiesterase